MSLKILDIGQCGYDGPNIERVLGKALQAEVITVDDLDAAKSALEAGVDVVLVNRVLAASGASGMDVIKGIKAGGYDVPVMLVSDKSDAQAEAKKLGAVAGFGKSQLKDPATFELITRAAGK